MKYFILVPDGSADDPGSYAEGLTPLAAAHIPSMDGLAKRGEVGLVRTIPDGVAPGSDAANLAVMGYDPVSDLTGRAPLEAVSMGIEMSDRDVAFRTNLVTLYAEDDRDVPYEERVITDHAAGDITTEEAAVLIRYLDENLGSGNPQNEGRVRFWPGLSYRHALIVQDGSRTPSGIGDVNGESDGYDLTAPHDILGKKIGAYLPKGIGSEFLNAFMEKSYTLLKDHPVNLDRKARGLNTADSIWVWGHGKKPAIASFRDKFGIEGSVISAVDLIKGIGICAGLSAVSIEGATGTFDTNYAGKAAAAIEAFRSGKDFVYLHVEAPDECSHQGNADQKLLAIERIDNEIMAPILAYLNGSADDFRVLIVPDHRTPVALRTHTSEPVPFVIYDSRKESYREENAFSERAGETGRKFESGKQLAEYFFAK
ncbi:MAG: cofactor-independent phosphoglycerate mutase [Clostridiales Family XIII bacterium]|jgi:2,3-bisphosphoglycerate-independent phosphoglycerate mutase|nr:cofactor-independent phosphoglycerate mutase [Clostridiales Family XIII bacterium]